MLCRKGLYTSHLDKWRRQRDRGALQALAPQKRGPKVDPQAAEIAWLRRENERLQARLRQPETIIEVQKKTLCAARPVSERERRTPMIQAGQQLAETQSVATACMVLGVERSSLNRTEACASASAAPTEATTRPAPPRKLSQAEHAQVREILNSNRFQDKAPREVYAEPLDEEQ